MQLTKLLDRSEQRQFDVLQLLLKSVYPVTISEIGKTFNINRNTAKSCCDDLSSMLSSFNGKIQLTETDGWVALDRQQATISLTEIYELYLKHSVKYQLLIYLFKHDYFDAADMVQKLNTSSSTLTRRVKELNQLLHDFQLQVKDGRLLGLESQIRHFYFQLFWLGTPSEKIKSLFNDPASNLLIDEIKQNYGNVLTINGQLKVKLYLGIVKRRRVINNLPATTFSDSLQFHSSLLSSNNITNLLNDFWRHYRIVLTDDEIDMFYSIVIANSCLNVDNPLVQEYLHNINLHTPQLAVLNSLTFNQFQSVFKNYPFSTHLTDQIRMSLFQIHFKSIQFSGWIVAYNKEHLTNLFSGDGEPNPLKYLLAKKIRSIGLNISKTVTSKLDKPAIILNQLQMELTDRYTAILCVACWNLDFKLKIGCDFDFENIMVQVAIKQVQQNIDPRTNAALELYDHNNYYDVIITNDHHRYSKINDNHVFVLIGTGYNFDYQYLNHFLSRAYLEKIHQLINLDNLAQNN